jgi:hypothetical protein
VQNVSIRGLCINNSGVVARVRVVTDTATFVDVIGQGSCFTPVTVALPQTGVTRIEIIDDVDQGGIGWDDLTFDFPQSAP